MGVEDLECNFFHDAGWFTKTRLKDDGYTLYYATRKIHTLEVVLNKCRDELKDNNQLMKISLCPEFFFFILQVAISLLSRLIRY